MLKVSSGPLTVRQPNRVGVCSCMEVLSQASACTVSGVPRPSYREPVHLFIEADIDLTGLLLGVSFCPGRYSRRLCGDEPLSRLPQGCTSPSPFQPPVSKSSLGDPVS